MFYYFLMCVNKNTKFYITLKIILTLNINHNFKLDKDIF